MLIARDTPIESINMTPYSQNKEFTAAIVRALRHPAINVKVYGDLTDCGHKEKALAQFDQLHSRHLNRLIIFLETQRDAGDDNVMPLLSALTTIKDKREAAQAEKTGSSPQKDTSDRQENDTTTFLESKSFSLADPKRRSAEDQLAIVRSGVEPGQEVLAERLYNQGAYVLVKPTAPLQKSLKDTAHTIDRHTSPHS